MVDEQFRIDAEKLLEQVFMIIFPDLPDGTARDIAHGVQPLSLIHISEPTRH